MQWKCGENVSYTLKVLTHNIPEKVQTSKWTNSQQNKAKLFYLKIIISLFSQFWKYYFYNSVQYGKALHSIVHYISVQYCTVHFTTVQYYLS